jgi:sec-independent protein translocase protein TatC
MPLPPTNTLFSIWRELRFMLLKGLLAILGCAMLAFGLRQHIWSILLKPLPPAHRTSLINLYPAEPVLLDFSVAMGAGFVLATPILLALLYRFFYPALKVKERIVLLPLVLTSFLCFLAGLGFAYWGAIPILLNFFTSYGSSIATPSWSQSHYTSFLFRLLLAFGLLFQLPVISWILARLGIVEPAFLYRHFRIFVMIAFLLAAILTPPDVVSQLIMAIPILALGLLSVGTAYLASYKKDSP